MLADLAQAQEDAQRLSYRTTALHMVVEMFKEQLNLRTTAHTYFSNEFKGLINDNFKEQEGRLKRAEEELETTSHQITQTQEKVRELALAKDEMDRKMTKLFRKMDWHERLMSIEGINNDMIVNGIAPFAQKLGKLVSLNQ